MSCNTCTPTACANTCSLEELCAKFDCLSVDFNTLWNDVYGAEESVYIATGNIGIPAAQDLIDDAEKYALDAKEYTRGAMVINSLKPTGVFITGDANYDEIDMDTYDIVGQESKIISGFSQLLTDRKLFPVMGDLDYWPAEDFVGTLPEKMAKTYLSMFSYLPDAKRYYSVYDPKSKTEFYVLSSGRFMNYTDQEDTGFVYANDSIIGDDQHDWLVARTTASPAKNKVVIFHDPFTSITDTFEGNEALGDENVFDLFENWDFQAMGVSLIINGHSGNSFHLRRSSVNIVNASAFSRSRFSFHQVDGVTEPPEVDAIYGEQGWSIEYFSHQPMGDIIENTYTPAGFFIIPKNEFFKMRCTVDGITCEFWSYDPFLPTAQEVLSSLNLEYSFVIPSN